MQLQYHIAYSHRFLRAKAVYAMLALLSFINIPLAFTQDIHFSQYNASPANLNPALTGFFEGDFRAVINYRGQWGSFTNPYKTIAGSFEYSPFKGKMKYDNFALGVQIFNDAAGDSRFSTTNFGLSAAYKKQISSGRKKHALSTGLQINMLQQRIQFSDLQFDNQFNGIEWDEDIAPNEVLNQNSNFAPDINVGLLWQYIPHDAFNFYLGGAMYHILQPKISLINASDYRLPSRYVAHAGSYIYASRLVNILPSAAFMLQAGSWQVNAGSYVQFVLDDWNDKQTAFALGTWARVAQPAVDAVIVGARLDFQGFMLGFSYDFNISKLQVASQTRGAYELSFIYNGNFSSKGQRRYMIPCPQL